MSQNQESLLAVSRLALLCLALASSGNASASVQQGGALALSPILDSSSAAPQLQSTCSAQWLPTTAQPQGFDQRVDAMIAFDDGSGPALFAVGGFTKVGGVTVNHIAKWNGTSWGPLGLGLDDRAIALAVFDDGSGPALYVAGDFQTAGGVSASNVAKWDGTDWSALGSGFPRIVFALEVHDGGSGVGPQLYAGGYGPVSGGTNGLISRWDGTGWTDVGTTNQPVFTLRSFDDGSGAGPRLYVGGEFTSVKSIGGQNVGAHHVAMWDGSTWATLGVGTSDWVYDLELYDDGSGQQLYVAGEFGAAGGNPALRIARWDGASWSSVPGGKIGGGPIFELGLHDEGGGAGPVLIAGGAFMTANGVPAKGVARWDGTSWSSLGGGVVGFTLALGSYTNDSGQPKLFAGGLLSSAGGDPVSNIACWDGSIWSATWGGANYIGDQVRAIVAHSAGSASALYLGGGFTTVGGIAAKRVVRWDGMSWSALGGGLQSEVRALAWYDDGAGGGEQLYAGGQFKYASGVAVDRIAKWDGVSWTALGTGLDATVDALAVYDDGSGPALFAAGSFDTAGGIAASGVAKWDGTSWSAVGSLVSPQVNALCVYDDGSGAGPALYAAGDIASADGVVVNNIARWDGMSWSALMPPASWPGLAGRGHALASFDDGGGSQLYVGGEFVGAGGVSVDNLARWDGTNWSAAGAGTQNWIGARGGQGEHVTALAVHDAGSGGGPALYATGNVWIGQPVGDVARWDGLAWTSLASEFDGYSYALASFNDGGGTGPVLFVGGDFVDSAAGDRYLAGWGGCGGPETYCTAGTSASGCQALLSASGVPSASATSGFDLIASTVEGSKDGLFFYGTNGRQANTWGSGTSFVCVVPPRVRGSLQVGSGSPGACDGSFTLDLNARWCATCPKPAHNPGAGAVMQAQLWYRDPLNSSNQTSSMSDAIEFVVAP